LELNIEAERPEMAMGAVLSRTTMIVAILAASSSSLFAQGAQTHTSYKEDMIAEASERFAPVLRRFIETQEDACSEIDDGELTINLGGAQYMADFNGDGTTDPIIDGGVFNCSTSATLFHGFGAGRMIDVFVSTNDPKNPYQQFSFTGYGNAVVSLGNKAILLMAQDGVNCDALGSDICFAAYSCLDRKFVAAGGAVERGNP
jgi:hypothetical protein